MPSAEIIPRMLNVNIVMQYKRLLIPIVVLTDKL